MWTLEYDTNKPINAQKQIQRHREQTCGCQWGGEWGREGLGVWD